MIKPGDSFGDYRVLKLLGKGGMGSVFLLENDEGVQVAAKILDPATAGDHESRKRFLREAELAIGVQHPNLVETYDVGEDPETGLCYILMEYAPNGSLADRIKTGPLAVNDAVRIVYQIASVLELARQKGIVHRDIKPGNILFGADGKAKLADLGIARGGVGGVGVTTVTQTGMMIGTPAYMAPEQMLDAHNVDSRADIYSLGIVFYEMLAGKRPNADDTVVQLMAKAVAGEPIPDVRTMRPEVSAAVAELISLMCAIKTDERIATPVEVTTALSQIVHGREVTIRRKRPAAAAVKAQRRPRGDGARKLVALLFGLLAVAGLGYFGYQAMHHRVSPTGRPSASPATSDAKVLESRPAVVPKKDLVVWEVTNVIERTVVATNVVERIETPKQIHLPVVATKPPTSNVITNGPPIVLSLGAGVKLTLVNCPAGSFSMGYGESDWPSHAPRQVRITRQFWIGRVPVTVVQWQRIMGDFALKESDRVFGHLDLAVGRISDDEMLEFCRILTERFARLLPKGYVFRLPSDAEWEYACKAGSTDPQDPHVRYRYAALSQEQRISVKRQDMVEFFTAKGYPDAKKRQYDFLWPVGTKSPNRWGIHDMIGLGAELLSDTFPRFDDRTGLPRNQAAQAKDGCRPQEETDPISICMEPGFVRLMRCSSFRGPTESGAGKRWYTAHHRAGIETFRIVAGPDLVREKGGVGTVFGRHLAPQVEKHPARIAALPSKTFKLPKSQVLELVGCPAGTFRMGYPDAPPDRRASKVHEVRITRPFWIGKHPVTREQWSALMGRRIDLDEIDKALGGMKAPMTHVDLPTINEFLQRLNRRLRSGIPKGYVFRLPTDAEWEYALRAGSADPGDPHVALNCPRELRETVAVLKAEMRSILAKAGITDIPDDRKGLLGSVAVCTKKPNGWGIYDMLGNVGEWVLDRFPIEDADGRYRKVGDVLMSGIDYRPSETDPLRWYDKADVIGIVRENLALGYPGVRRFILPSNRFGIIGFRVVLGPDLEKEQRDAARATKMRR